MIKKYQGKTNYKCFLKETAKRSKRRNPKSRLNRVGVNFNTKLLC
jgi:hypothetical protein